MGIVKKLDSWVEKVAIALLVSGVTSMLLLAVLTIVLRWFQMSLPWLDPMVRHLVFATTFLGGVVATGRGSHIGIDILSKTFEVQGNKKALTQLKRLTSLVSFFTLSWLVFASWGFMKIELEFGRDVFLGLHSGYLVGIIPVGIGLIAFRFLNVFIQTFSSDQGEEA